MASEVIRKSMTRVYDIAGAGLSVGQTGTAHKCHRVKQIEEHITRATCKILETKQRRSRKNMPSNNLCMVRVYHVPASIAVPYFLIYLMSVIDLCRSRRCRVGSLPQGPRRLSKIALISFGDRPSRTPPSRDPVNDDGLDGGVRLLLPAYLRRKVIVPARKHRQASLPADKRPSHPQSPPLPRQTDPPGESRDR